MSDPQQRTTWPRVGAILAFFMEILFTMVASVGLVFGMVELELLLLKAVPALQPPPPKIRNILEMVAAEETHGWKHIAVCILIVLIMAQVYKRVFLPGQHRKTGAKAALWFLGIGLIFTAFYHLATESYTRRYEGLQEKAIGHVFVIGAWESADARDYQKDTSRSFTEMVDDHPEAIDKLWSESAVSTAYLILGTLYVCCLVFLCMAIATAGECGVDVIKHLWDHSNNQVPNQAPSSPAESRISASPG